MYNAPAVLFPVGRSWIYGQVLALLWTTGSLAVVYWLVLFNRPVWEFVGMAALMLVGGFSAAWQWRQSWVGTLRWDRQKWVFTALDSDSRDVHTLSGVSVLLDLQAALLVRFDLSGGKRVTFWLDRATAKPQWPALRRALYARPRAPKKKSLARTSMQQKEAA